MPCFSIDDVRDSFTADVSAFIGRIEQTAQAALATEALQPAALWKQGRPGFEAMADVGHAIVGTTSLVGAYALNGSAHMIEELASAGESALAEMEQAAARARAVAEVCLEGAIRMRDMMTMELAHRGTDAEWLAADWVERAVVDHRLDCDRAHR